MSSAQTQAYIAWVNVQLKKKADTRLVEDLSTDMHDGVALIHLIHIVAGEELSDVHMTPATRDEMLHNVTRVIEFMRGRDIRMHHTSSADIVDGNVKAIMRLILALAAHFKPNSVKQSAQAARAQTFAGLAQGAAATLADARKDANRTSQRPRRPKHLAQDRGEVSDSNSDHTHISATSQGSFPPSLHQRGVLDGASSVATSPPHSSLTSPCTSILGSPHQRPRHAQKISPSALPKSKSVDFRQQGEDAETRQVAEEFARELIEEYADLQSDMKHTKSALLMLQDLLLSGRIADGAESVEGCPAEGGTQGEEMVVLRSKLQYSDEMSQQLKEQLSQLRQESMQLQGVKAGLQQRLSEQEHSFLVMKAELLRAGFAQQALETAKADLEKKMEEKDSLVLDLKRELAKREREIDELTANFTVEQQQRDATTRALRAQITELHGKLQRVGETEAALSARVASQDRKMARLEGKIMATSYDSGSTRHSSCRSTHSASSEEMQMVRDSLHSLRRQFHGSQSQHEAIDTLESSIAALMDRLHGSDSSPASDCQAAGHSVNSVPHSVSASPSLPQGFSRLEAPADGNHSTKILYFTDRTVTPFMCTFPKRLGEISLRDVKSIVDRQGNHRYHFKAMDPEFGTVKEEVLHDDDIVPGWEGKIVAWVEEDHG